jgi:hypothetical protein
MLREQSFHDAEYFFLRSIEQATMKKGALLHKVEGESAVESLLKDHPRKWRFVVGWCQMKMELHVGCCTFSGIY